jgi:hypothetical protein
VGAWGAAAAAGNRLATEPRYLAGWAVGNRGRKKLTWENQGNDRKKPGGVAPWRDGMVRCLVRQTVGGWLGTKYYSMTGV